MATPNFTPLAEIAQMQPDQPVFWLRGKVVSVFQPKGDTNEHGPWKFQSIVIQDAAGTKIDVKLKNRRDGEDVPTAWKGKEIIIENVKTDQGGWKSVTAWDDEYKGKFTRKVKVTATAGVYLAAEANQHQQGNQAAKPAPAQPPQNQGFYKTPQQQPAAHEPHSPDDDAMAIRSMRYLIAQNANVYTLCIGAVNGMVAPYFENITGVQMSQEHFQAATATLFIQAIRERSANTMPASPLPHPKPHSSEDFD